MMDHDSWHNKYKPFSWHSWQPIYLTSCWFVLNPIARIRLTMKAHGFNSQVCKHEKKLLERLNQATLGIIVYPDKTP
jgi:hypothetical protein